MERVTVFLVGVMLDALLGTIFATLGVAYVMAKAGAALPPLSEWFGSADVLWIMGATVIVAVVLNIPREVRNWLESE